jgi:hypothetical protein
MIFYDIQFVSLHVLRDSVLKSYSLYRGGSLHGSYAVIVGYLI